MSQKIMVTGAQGFLGSNFVDYLYNHTDYKIYAVSRSTIDKFYPADRFVPIVQDLLSPMDDYILNSLAEIDYIVHFAGSSDVQRSVLYPMETFHNNVVMTATLLEFARTNIKNLRQFIFFSTAEVFGPSKNSKKFTEDSVINPRSPYAATKAAAGEMCKMFYTSYNVPAIITYVMNVYGKNQSNDKFIPKIIQKISNDETIELHANSGPDQRNYLHVDDICDAILFIMRNGQVGCDYNIVSDRYSDNLEIAELIARVLQKDLKFELQSSDKHHTLSLLDGTRLTKLGWKPKIPLEIGLRKFIYDK